jgi:hypothetical protein
MSERRGEVRLGSADSVAVTVISAPGAERLNGRTFFCVASDVSEGGIRLKMDTRVPGSTLMDIRVAFSDPLQSFKHRGRVAWISEMAETAQFAVGIELLDRNSPAMRHWASVIKSKRASGSTI